jgi:hypothetical protein
MPIILATWEAEIGRIMVPDQLRQVFLETPISKIIRTKWTESVAQGVERLLCKCEPLSSNFSPTKKKKKKKKYRNNRNPYQRESASPAYPAQSTLYLEDAKLELGCS